MNEPIFKEINSESNSSSILNGNKEAVFYLLHKLFPEPVRCTIHDLNDDRQIRSEQLGIIKKWLNAIRIKKSYFIRKVFLEGHKKLTKILVKQLISDETIKKVFLRKIHGCFHPAKIDFDLENEGIDIRLPMKCDEGYPFGYPFQLWLMTTRIWKTKTGAIDTWDDYPLDEIRDPKELLKTQFYIGGLGKYKFMYFIKPEIYTRFIKITVRDTSLGNELSWENELMVKFFIHNIKYLLFDELSMKQRKSLKVIRGELISFEAKNLILVSIEGNTLNVEYRFDDQSYFSHEYLIEDNNKLPIKNL
jgi:hypothetical protein